MNPETKIQNLILMKLSEAGCLVFRNETGAGWVGKMLHREAGQVTLANASMVKFGLMVGSADIIGISPTGKFLAVEIKTSKGRATKEQLRFIEAVNKAGGIAGIARSVEEALNLIRD